MTASNEVLKSADIGDVAMPFIIDRREVVTRMTDVLYVPGLTVNLISVKQLGAKGFQTVFCDEKRCEISDKVNKLRAVAPFHPPPFHPKSGLREVGCYQVYYYE